MSFNALPDYDYLVKNYAYDPETGEVHYIKTGRGRKLGETAGAASGRQDRVYLHIKGRRYARSRIAWLMMTGNDPCDHDIDHINGDPTDDRWANLRRLTRSENLMARRAYNKSGMKNITVRFSKRLNRDRYTARCNHNGTSYYLGTFDTPDEAQRAVAEHYREQGLLMYQSPAVRKTLCVKRVEVPEAEVA